jgi:hypothetical protein
MQAVHARLPQASLGRIVEVAVVGAGPNSLEAEAGPLGTRAVA